MKTPQLPRAIREALRQHGTVPGKRDPGPSIDEWDEVDDPAPKCRLSQVRQTQTRR